MRRKKDFGNKLSALALGLCMTISGCMMPLPVLQAPDTIPSVQAADSGIFTIDIGAAEKGKDGVFTFPNLKITVPEGIEIKGVTVQFTSPITAADCITLSAAEGFTEVSGSKNGNRSVNADGKDAKDWEDYLRANLRVTLDGDDMKKLRIIASSQKIEGIYDYNVENGHYYQAVSTTMTWTQALAAAQTNSYMGMQGYLVTITTEHENEFVYSLIGQNMWLGGTCDPTYTKDPSSNNRSLVKWYWVSGPEGIADDGKPLLFWEGQPSLKQSTSPNDESKQRNGCYLHWSDYRVGQSADQPDFNGGTEMYLQTWAGSSYWNDLTNGTALPYVIEYGGMPDDLTGGGEGMFTSEEVNLDPTGKTLSTSAKDIVVGEPISITDKANGAPVDEVTHVFFQKTGDSWTPVDGEPAHAGEYKVESSKTGYNGDSDVFIISPKEISADPEPADAEGKLTSYSKVYDGNTAYTGEIVLKGLPEGADVQLSYNKAEFNDQNVAEADTITLSGVTLTGADAGDYLLVSEDGDSIDAPEDTLTVPGKITPRPLRVVSTFPVQESWVGVPLPYEYGHNVTEYQESGTWGSMLAEGDTLADTLGTPAYTCQAGSTRLDRTFPFAGTYILRATFPDATSQAQDNYDIAYENITIWIKERQAPIVRPGTGPDDPDPDSADPGGTDPDGPEPLTPDEITTDPDGTVHVTVTDSLTEKVHDSGSLTLADAAEFMKTRYDVVSALPDGMLTWSAATITKDGRQQDVIDLTKPGTYVLSITVTDGLNDTTTIRLTYRLVSGREGAGQGTATPGNGSGTVQTGDHPGTQRSVLLMLFSVGVLIVFGFRKHYKNQEIS